MDTFSDIKTKLKDQKKELFKKYPIKTLAIFGSFARNEQTASSDLDLMVEFNSKVALPSIELSNKLQYPTG
ncbi:MAG: nucleotidyltransferase domain-containing protein [Algoriphagus sp.]|uniref:nucleotidyltransferase family protein n=1 Tax=Algoriphagus sp. TaxID=1872435 RepID=UPI002730FB5A|nr:nucleotidyltransferase domain-containing protein [Algoriphagus sp.]MDP2040327.1 nucleotidyltransferase domain-containing protein [Algoriphagus sp.]MDP3473585.1 nucleotidyltransferase domain-containing protein [Algoriphagus sp.]